MMQKVVKATQVQRLLASVFCSRESNHSLSIEYSWSIYHYHYYYLVIIKVIMGKGGRAVVADKKEHVEIPQISWEEVKKHNTPKDAWMVHQNKVYDVSDWYEHPG